MGFIWSESERGNWVIRMMLDQELISNQFMHFWLLLTWTVQCPVSSGPTGQKNDFRRKIISNWWLRTWLLMMATTNAMFAKRTSSFIIPWTSIFILWNITLITHFRYEGKYLSKQLKYFDLDVSRLAALSWILLRRRKILFY